MSAERTRSPDDQQRNEAAALRALLDVARERCRRISEMCERAAIEHERRRTEPPPA